MTVSNDQIKESINNSKFEEDLSTLINKYSLENGSNTPDFILAQYLRGCLEAFNTAVTSRSTWYKH
jgi:hypothetical protein